MGKMYAVPVQVTGDATVYVEAENKEDAIEKAMLGEWAEDWSLGELDVNNDRNWIRANGVEECEPSPPNP